MKVFSFSLYGDNPIYKIGLLKNIELIKEIFPSWNVFVYLPKGYDEEYVNILNTFNVHTYFMEDEKYYNSCWRFLAITHNEVEVMVCRDADSRISVRDKAAIEEWLGGGYNYNIIRDHPIGHHWAINAGMWGAKKTPFISEINLYLDEYKKVNRNLIDKNTFDQLFLRSVIYPNIVSETLVHDEYFKYEPQSKKIEHDRKSNDFAFIGESIDENDVPRGDQRTPIKQRYVELV